MAKALASELEKTGYSRNIIISCGLDIVTQAIARKKESGAMLVSVLDPANCHEEFDYIFTSAHEPIANMNNPEGKNIYKIHGLLNEITPDSLQQTSDFDYLPCPLYAVLVGGKHVGGNVSEEDAANLARFLNSKNASAIITTSRRTEIMVTQKLKEKLSRPHVIYDYNYDGQDDNPYLKILAAADEIIVTADSARMMSEAASSGKTCNIYLPEELHFSYKAMAEDLIANGYANDMKNFGKPTMLLAEAKRCANIIASGK